MIGGGNASLIGKEMAKKYKIRSSKTDVIDDENGMNIRLFKADEIVESKGDWQDSIMDGFVANGWAMEVKVDSVEETVDEEASRTKKTRNEKGQLVGDDPDTPDVNEAWEGGEAPKKKVAKKSTKKKSTKKK